MQDIAVIGGGPVGLCAALALERIGYGVAVIEAATFNDDPPQGLNRRSIALSTSSVQIFRALGLWEAIAAQAAAIRHIHISARGRWGVTRLAADEFGLDALGYVIESHALNRCLLDALGVASKIRLLDGAEFETVEQPDPVRIGYRRGGKQQRLDARIALIADGANSRARERLGIDHQSVDYAQSAIVCNVEVSQARQDTAYERFTRSGPLAMLPLGGRRYACVWTLDPDLAPRLADCDEAEFVGELQACFGYRLGLVERVGERVAFPLRRTRAERLYQGRCLLLGNAANALHPVAGQSFNLSLRDIASLYELLHDAPSAPRDEQSFARLAADYENQRLSEQARVIRYGDGLVTLFSNELPLIDSARAAGLGLLDLLPALKAQVALTGMGMTFGGNRMLRGHL